MRRTKRGGWPYSQPPNVPFTINRASPQAVGLVAWMPWGGGTPGAHRHVDRVSGLVFTEGGTPVWVADGERGWSLLFDRTTPDYLLNTTFSITEPFTLACWANKNEGAFDGVLLSVADNSVPDDQHRLIIQATEQVIASTYDGTVSNAIATANVTLNTWEHICGVWAAANSRAAYLNAANKGTNADARAVVGIDTVAIGITADSTPFGAMSGRISDVRFYNIAKTDAEVYEMYANPWELYKPLIRRWLGWKVAIGATYYQSCAGALTYTGSITRKTSKGLSGALTPTGSIVKKTSISLSGALTFAGGLVKRTSISVSGALTFVGSLDAKGLFKQALSGALTFTGALGTVLLIRQALSGALSYIGSLATQYTAGPGGAWVRWMDHRLMKWRKKFE